jgi:protein-S-isoprenylcysteine O-methyltransferase Ste14
VNIPALAIGLMMGLYWARVLRLAYKQKKRTGNAGNLFPRETLGQVLRIIWFPAIFAWIAIPILTALLERRPRVLEPYALPRSLAWIVLAIAVAAFIATLICWKKMGKSWRMGIDPNDKTQLVISGPYARLRHPIYALSSLLMLCTMVIVPSPVMLAVGVVHLLLLQWEARREEAYLTTVHGQAYSDYAAKTGRFIPRF